MTTCHRCVEPVVESISIGGLPFCRECLGEAGLPFASFEAEEQVRVSWSSRILRAIWSALVLTTVIAAGLTAIFAFFCVLYCFAVAPDPESYFTRLMFGTGHFFGFACLFVGVIGLPLGITMALLLHPTRIWLEERNLHIQRPAGVRTVDLDKCRWKSVHNASDKGGFYLPGQRAIVLRHQDDALAIGFDEHSRLIWERVFCLLGITALPKTDLTRTAACIAVCAVGGSILGAAVGRGLQTVTGEPMLLISAGLTGVFDGLLVGALRYTDRTSVNLKPRWLVISTFALIPAKCFPGLVAKLVAAAINMVIGWCAMRLLRPDSQIDEAIAEV